jgi:hypothetical protein
MNNAASPEHIPGETAGGRHLSRARFARNSADGYFIWPVKNIEPFGTGQ